MKRMTQATLLAGLLLAGPARAAQPTLWSVGTSDNNTAEFALAPADYRAYRTPGFFIVGESDPKTAWPYIQPGTLGGGWAPGTPQTFAVWFALDAAPAGDAALVLDLNDTHNLYPSKLRVTVNDQSGDYDTPRGADAYSDPGKGIEHIITIPVSAKALTKGLNQVSITTLNGAWIIWDCLRMEAPEGTQLGKVANYRQSVIGPVSSEDALFWKDGKKVQQVEVEITHLGKPVTASVRVGTENTGIELVQGRNRVTAAITPVTQAVTLPVIVAVGETVLSTPGIALKPVRDWEIHMVHQTHLDIGFTHTQANVLALQVEHLRHALKLIERTRNYPDGSRFIWHPEGMWAVEEFMRVSSEEEKKIFVEACRNRQIHLDVLYAQAMTGMYNDEELFELMGAAKRFEKKYGVTITSAMQSDVPGYTWGLVSALAHNGVKHLSVGPNWFANGSADTYYQEANILGKTHRGGRVFDWGDKPFYWLGPDGKSKVLFCMPGWGYSGFHGDRGALNKEKIFAYTRHLELTGYPYDMIYWRYGIGADNGPPRDDLSDVVKAWNEKYASPRLVLTTNSGALEEFEKRYADRIPQLSGDYTPYWEDGAASTADATSVNRRASEKIAQAQTVWSMVDPSLKLHDKFFTAWNKMIMYDEHTWGAYCSISQPDSAFSVSQDEYKQAYARDGSALTDSLLQEITKAPASSQVIDVYNTSSAAAGGIVTLSKEQSAYGDRVLTPDGKPVPSQRLSSGDLVFLAAGVPALGAARYAITKGAPLQQGEVTATEIRLQNKDLTLEIDPASGTITSLRLRGLDRNLADTSKSKGLNDYLYILGRDANQGRSGIEGEVEITIEDPGPLVATIRIDSGAPGCHSLTRRVRLASGADHVLILNSMDKAKELRPEGAYFGFPFDIPGSVARVDVPWATVEVEKQQLKGANRNFYCVQRWVDLSNADFGVTWASVDAHMVQFDPLIIAQPFGNEYYREKIEPGSHIWSWTINNHWECNYKAYQTGMIHFAYAIRPHTGSYDAVAAQQFGRAVCQPLLAVPSSAARPLPEPLFALAGDPGIVVTTVRPSEDGKAWMVRLFNTAEETRETSLKWNRRITQTFISNPMEEIKEVAPARIPLGQHEIITLRVEHGSPG